MSESSRASDELDPEDFSSPDTDNGGEQDQKLSVDPGEKHVGRITDANLAAGSHGLIEVDGQTLWLNGSLAQQLVAGLLVGEPVCFSVDDEERSFTPADEDEPVTYHEKQLKFLDN